MVRQIATVIAVFGAVAWVSWLIFESVRQYMVVRMQNAAQDKLLARVSSPESLEVFLASDAGKHFMLSLGKDPYEAWFGIIRSLRTAVMFGVLGAALIVGHFLKREAPGLLEFGVGGLAVALAFALSGILSFVMHRYAGLVPRRRG